MLFVKFHQLLMKASCLPMTVGSRSTKNAQGTCLPAPVSLKMVFRRSHLPPTWHLSMQMDHMIQAVELPACISNLSPSLANVDRDTFTLEREKGITQVTCH